MKRIIAIGVAGALAAAGVVAVSAPAQAYTASNPRVSISEELDLPYSSPGVGPLQYGVSGIVAGSGVELSADDVVPGTANRWSGHLNVDVRPDTHQIVLAADLYTNYQTMDVRFTSSQMRYRSIVSDQLVTFKGAILHPTITQTSTGFTLSWDSKSTTTLYMGQTSGNTLVLSYKDVTSTVASASVSGSTVKVKGTVIRFDGSRPTASAKVYEGSKLIGTITSNGGTKAFSATKGTHTYTVKYLGTTTLQPSTKTVTVTVH